MKVRDFFEDGQLLSSWGLADIEYVKTAIALIEKDPWEYIRSALESAAKIEDPHAGRCFILGVFVGFAASDERIQDFQSEVDKGMN